MLLKWFNPLTEKQDQKIAQLFGALFSSLIENKEGINEHLQNAILPTLEAIAEAPKQSPLSDVDLDSLVRILASMTHCKDNSENIHKNLSYLLCFKIKNMLNIISDARLYSKMLVALDVSGFDKIAVCEVIAMADELLDTVSHIVECIFSKCPLFLCLSFLILRYIFISGEGQNCQ